LPVQLDFFWQTITDVELFDVGRPAQEGRFVAEEQAGQVGNAGFAVQDLALFRGVVLDIARHLRAGADKAHFAGQDVPQLRQFIELGFAQDAAQARDARVFTRGQRGAEPLGLEDHGTELPDAKGPAEPAHADLTVEDRAAIGELDAQANQQAQREHQDDAQSSARQVKQALGRSARPAALLQVTHTSNWV